MPERGSARLARQPGQRTSNPYPLTVVDLEALVTAAHGRLTALEGFVERHACVAADAPFRAL